MMTTDDDVGFAGRGGGDGGDGDGAGRAQRGTGRRQSIAKFRSTDTDATET
jgi:hypothetical protein